MKKLMILTIILFLLLSFFLQATEFQVKIINTAEDLPENFWKGTAKQLSKALGKRLEKSGIGSSKENFSWANLKAIYSTSCRVIVFIIQSLRVSAFGHTL